ncbi:MAG: hypothetical protein K0R83_1764, partial [Caulobacter sp.]|nr:hypothetical protein [Caulobacter sp.]
GFACLGALGDAYRPGLDFGELCMLLLDIASYQNYDLLEGYNSAAREWAMSEEGMRDIAARGGKPAFQRFLDTMSGEEAAGLGIDRRVNLKMKPLT